MHSIRDDLKVLLDAAAGPECSDTNSIEHAMAIPCEGLPYNPSQGIRLVQGIVHKGIRLATSTAFVSCTSRQLVEFWGQFKLLVTMVLHTIRPRY